MATTSEVKAGLDQISDLIARVRAKFVAARQEITSSATLLGQIPTDYADVIATINLFTPTGEFESLAKDEKSKLQTEFQALKADMDALIAATEFNV